MPTVPREETTTTTTTSSSIAATAAEAASEGVSAIKSSSSSSSSSTVDIGAIPTTTSTITTTTTTAADVEKGVEEVTDAEGAGRATPSDRPNNPSPDPGASTGLDASPDPGASPGPGASPNPLYDEKSRTSLESNALSRERRAREKLTEWTEKKKREIKEQLDRDRAVKEEKEKEKGGSNVKCR